MSELRQPTAQSPTTPIVIARLKQLQQNCPYLTAFETASVDMAVDHLSAARELYAAEYMPREWRVNTDAEEYRRMVTLAMGAFIAVPEAQAHYPARFVLAVAGASGFLYVSLALTLEAVRRLGRKP